MLDRLSVLAVTLALAQLAGSSQSVRPYSQSTESRAALASVRLVWLGWDADRVGHGPQGEPDGKFDHHFRLTLVLGSAREVRSIALFKADDRGRVVEQHHWASAEADSEILGVEHDGRRLNPRHVPSLGRFRGTVVFDLFAGDLGGFDVGDHGLVEVAMDDGRALRQTVALVPPEGRLIGQWNALCPAESPQTFEPMTISGRFYVDLAADGRITGRFGDAVVTGRLDSSGVVSGSGIAATETIMWRGTITPASRGRRLAGKGDLTLQIKERPCLGGSWWSQ